MPLSDLNMVFESIGDAAASQGAERVASGVGKVRSNFSGALERIGKVQGQINALSGVIAGFGFGGITSQSMRQEDLKRSPLGDSVTSFAEMALTGGGAFVGALVGPLVGSIIPVVGPIIGAIAGPIVGGILGGLLTSTIEPLIQDIAQAFRAVKDRVNDYISQSKTQNDTITQALVAMNEDFMRMDRSVDATLYNTIVGRARFEKKIAETTGVAIDEAVKKILEFSGLIQESISPELNRLRMGQQEGGLVVRDSIRSRNILNTLTDRAVPRSETQFDRIPKGYKEVASENLNRATNFVGERIPTPVKEYVEDAYNSTIENFNTFVNGENKFWNRAMRK